MIVEMKHAFLDKTKFSSMFVDPLEQIDGYYISIITHAIQVYCTIYFNK